MFGSGVNSFAMEFVVIGSRGNQPDSTGNPIPAGGVGYNYGIGKYEVSEDMINKYNASFGASQNLVIGKDTRGTNKPATNISWNEAARFVNWLNTSTGASVAYKYAGGNVNSDIVTWTSSDVLDYDPANPYRSKRTVFALPSYNEWYKAAF